MVYNYLECMRLVAAFILGDSSPGLLSTLGNKFHKIKAIINYRIPKKTYRLIIAVKRLDSNSQDI